MELMPDKDKDNDKDIWYCRDKKLWCKYATRFGYCRCKTCKMESPPQNEKAPGD